MHGFESKKGFHFSGGEKDSGDFEQAIGIHRHQLGRAHNATQTDEALIKMPGPPSAVQKRTAHIMQSILHSWLRLARLLAAGHMQG
jgi:hypothetical protein